MKYLTMTQLQEKLGGRGRTTIYRDVENERLPKPLKLGSRLYWVESAVGRRNRLCPTASRLMQTPAESNGSSRGANHSTVLADYSNVSRAWSKIQGPNK